MWYECGRKGTVIYLVRCTAYGTSELRSIMFVEKALGDQYNLGMPELSEIARKCYY